MCLQVWLQQSRQASCDEARENVCKAKPGTKGKGAASAYGDTAGRMEAKGDYATTTCGSAECAAADSGDAADSGNANYGTTVGCQLNMGQEYQEVVCQPATRAAGPAQADVGTEGANGRRG